MFKKTLFAAVVMGAMVTGAQAAEINPNGYLFGSVGQADADLNWTDEKDTAFKIGAGVQLNPYVGVEFQYVDLGEAVDKYRDALNSASVSAATDGFGANLVGTLPMDRFKLFGKVGYHKLDTDIKVRINNASGSGSESEWVTSYGVGASFALSPAFEVVAEYERYNDVADEYDIDLLSAGLRYNF